MWEARFVWSFAGTYRPMVLRGGPLVNRPPLTRIRESYKGLISGLTMEKPRPTDLQLKDCENNDDHGCAVDFLIHWHSLALL